MGSSTGRTWTTHQVVRLSGVSSRALRHWDAVGLLRPAGTGAGGVRRYGEAELLRLQRLLLLRELGLPLAEVGALLDEHADPAQALRAHLARLDAEAERLAQVRATVLQTLTDLEEGDGVDAERMYQGFDPAQQERYEREVASRYGEEVVAESRRRVAALPPGQLERTDADFAAAEQAVADLMVQGAASDDPRVLDALEDHVAVLRRFWEPTAESYSGLGEMYAEHADFRARYESRAPGLADFLRDAMAAYALTRL